jgi:hypothetical protein
MVLENASRAYNMEFGVWSGGELHVKIIRASWFSLV